MPSTLCIGLLVGTLVHSLPSSAVTLSWLHTVERTAWEEDYIVDGNELRLREARVKSSGAGMDPPSDAVWHDGWWRYRPKFNRLPEIVLANSEFGGGYRLCWSDTSCQPMDAFVAKGSIARLMPTPCTEQKALQ